MIESYMALAFGFVVALMIIAALIINENEKGDRL